jgi:hypothetical protein
MQLTKNFQLSELIHSQTASRLGIDNSPNAFIRSNLKLLCQRVLQPVRDYYGLPLIISSGYRSKALNAVIPGSSNTSQHTLGQAADFVVPTIPNYDVALWIRDNLNFDQLILEYYVGGNTGWIHCSYSGRKKNQLLTFNGKQYFTGLIK